MPPRLCKQIRPLLREGHVDPRSMDRKPLPIDSGLERGAVFVRCAAGDVAPAVLDGGPIGGNLLPPQKKLTSPYLLNWEKSNVDNNDEQQLPVHRKQGLWPG
jgi:hypothetical protein